MEPVRISFFVPILLICGMLSLKSLMKIFALTWLLFISVLFFLPGSALPQGDLFDFPYFDKVVHFVFFAVLVFSWRFYFDTDRKFTWLLFFLAFCYGMGVEVIQHYFIANRSFDLWDVLADMTGAVAGLLFWTGRYRKK